jgi:hypothetical protein
MILMSLLEACVPTLRRREAEELNECVGISVLIDELAVLALVREGAIGKPSGEGFSATIFHCPYATARRCFAPDHEIGMIRHSGRLECPRTDWQPILVGWVFLKSRIIF